ncbi:MAG: GDP-L-fucose synthase [Solirubrobacterales bacterium]|nr:GDP-L-fucose synthase [Solirubrobacterales bacterium]
MTYEQPTAEFFTGKRVAVTGGAGFLGSHVTERLEQLGVTPFLPRSVEYDLTREDDVVRMYEDANPDIVIHLAARVGGIGANRKNPGAYWYDNLMMGALLLEHARRSEVDKFVQLGTICSYPKFAEIPFREETLWDGYPEETNAPYGIAKKALLAGVQSYHEQYDMDALFLMPVNLYGPRDNFDLQSSHVIPALIRKMVEADERGENVVLWGDGTPSREFLFVDDCARGLLLATERYDKSDPVNIGAGFEITIKDLAELIAKQTGFSGSIEWDTSMPGGQPRRKLDTERAKEEFGFEASVQFEEGIAQTVEWFRGHREWIDQDVENRAVAEQRAAARG